MRASAHTRAESRETDKVSGSTAAASSADLLPAVAQAYGLTTRLQARKLTGGYANDVFLLEAEGPVVLHIKHPPLDLNSLTWEHQLLDLLRDRLPGAPAPLTALDGRTFLLHDQQLVWLTPYLPGHPAAPVDVRAVASALGRLHSVRIGVSPRPGHLRLSDVPIPPIRQMPSEFDDWLSLITQARSEMMELIKQIVNTRSITVGVTHNDIFPGNVLVQDGQVTALLDWEEAYLDWLVRDLASSIGAFCITSDGALDRRATESFVDSYRASGGRVSPEEDDLIVPLVRVKRILEVLRAPTDRHPRWDYQLANLRAYQRIR